MRNRLFSILLPFIAGVAVFWPNLDALTPASMGLAGALLLAASDAFSRLWHGVGRR